MNIEQAMDIRQQKILAALENKNTSVYFNDALDNEMILNMGPQHCNPWRITASHQIGWRNCCSVRSGVRISTSRL